MDWLTFISALFWPLVVLFGLVLFFEPLRNLIPRLQEVSIGGFKAVLQKAEESAKEAGPDFVMQAQGFVGLESGPTQEEIATVLAARPVLAVPPVAPVPLEESQLAASNPRTAILHAWHLVEVAAHAKAKALQAGAPLPSEPAVTDLMSALEVVQRRASVPVALFALVFQLRALHAQAQQAAESKISSAEALEYLKLARRAVAAFATEGPA